jgi:hypothetical protein
MTLCFRSSEILTTIFGSGVRSAKPAAPSGPRNQQTNTSGSEQICGRHRELGKDLLMHVHAAVNAMSLCHESC